MEWLIYTLMTFSIIGFAKIYINRRRSKEYLEINNIVFNQATKAK